MHLDSGADDLTCKVIYFHGNVFPRKSLLIFSGLSRKRSKISSFLRVLGVSVVIHLLYSFEGGHTHQIQDTAHHLLKRMDQGEAKELEI